MQSKCWAGLFMPLRRSAILWPELRTHRLPVVHGDQVGRRPLEVELGQIQGKASLTPQNKEKCSSPEVVAAQSTQTGQRESEATLTTMKRSVGTAGLLAKIKKRSLREALGHLQGWPGPVNTNHLSPEKILNLALPLTSCMTFSRLLLPWVPSFLIHSEVIILAQASSTKFLWRLDGIRKKSTISS